MPRACPTGRISRESREAFGSECDQFNSHRVLGVTVEFPERFATLAKRSGKIPQVVVPPNSLAIFKSESRGEEFFC